MKKEDMNDEYQKIFHQYIKTYEKYNNIYNPKEKKKIHETMRKHEYKFRNAGKTND